MTEQSQAEISSQRENLVNNTDEQYVEAFDVWQCFKAAQRSGLEVEWFHDFIRFMKNGDSPGEAAMGACLEWDVA